MKTLTSFEEAVEKINWYGKRWNIEVFHKILKSGCKIQECRLQTAERLLKYVALMTVVAWRIFWMTVISRHVPELTPEAVLAKNEIAVIQLFNKHRRRVFPCGKESAKEMIRTLGSLGGFLGRKSDGDPGPFVLWRGYLRLQDIMLGVSMARP